MSGRPRGDRRTRHKVVVELTDQRRASRHARPRAGLAPGLARARNRDRGGLNAAAGGDLHPRHHASHAGRDRGSGRVAVELVIGGHARRLFGHARRSSASPATSSRCRANAVLGRWNSRSSWRSRYRRCLPSCSDSSSSVSPAWRFRCSRWRSDRLCTSSQCAHACYGRRRRTGDQPADDRLRYGDRSLSATPDHVRRSAGSCWRACSSVCTCSCAAALGA